MAKKIWQNGRYVTVEDDHKVSDALDNDQLKDSFSLYPEGEKTKIDGWGPPKKPGNLKMDLQIWGISSIAMGVISIIFSRYLDPFWGIFLIVLGVLNLLIRHRAMLIVNGLSLLAVGVLNIVISIVGFSTSGFSTVWLSMGIFQIIWGIQEIRKFHLHTPGRKI